VSWSTLFYRWFLAQLIASLRELDVDAGTYAPGVVQRPAAGGQELLVKGSLILTKRQSNLLARPGRRVVVGNWGGAKRALGDSPRHRTVEFGRGGFVPPTPKSFADFLIPPAVPTFAAQRAFATAPDLFGDPFYPLTSLPLDDGGFAPVLPSFPLRFDPAGAYAFPFLPPAPIGAGLGMLAMAEWQHYLYDAPQDAWPRFGLMPSDNYTLGWENGANDWQWDFNASGTLRRPNLIWPYAAGVKNGAWYMRLPDAVASSAHNTFSYRHGHGPWVFPPTETALRILYQTDDWGSVQEMGYPHVISGLPTYPLTSPPDFETWFTDSPFEHAAWVVQGDCTADPADGQRYVLDPPMAYATAVRAAAQPYTLAVRSGWASLQDWGADLGVELDLLAWQPPLWRDIGDIRTSLGSPTPTPTIIGTTRVYETDAAEPGEGAIRVDRWLLTANPTAVHTTPERRVIDRYWMVWREDALRFAGPDPGACLGDTNGWDWNILLNQAQASALQLRFLDWGTCWQEYRVIVRRYAWSGFSFRHNSLQIVLQRRNHGGDFIDECGLTNWGVNSQRYLTANGSNIGLFKRMRPFDSDPDDPTGWWTRYPAGVTGHRAPLEALQQTYLDFWLSPGQPTSGPRCTIPAIRSIVGWPALFPWYTDDPTIPHLGRPVDPYTPNDAGKAAQPNDYYPNAPTVLAYDFNRAGVWYDVASIDQVGVREAYTTDDDYEESFEDGSGEVQVVVDDTGVPFYEPDPTSSWGAALADGFAVPDLGDIIRRYLDGANLYEGEFGTLPCPFGGVSRIETYCGLPFDAGDAFAVDVVTHPDGGYLALAVGLDWSYRISRGVEGTGGLAWSELAGGSIVDLLNEEDAAAFDLTSAPVQEYSFAESSWPFPLGRLRSSRQVLAFRATNTRSRAVGSAGVVAVRLAGSL
jgi:hypothetical protein